MLKKFKIQEIEIEPQLKADDDSFKKKLHRARDYIRAPLQPALLPSP